jgi:hypothetical protein
VVGPSPDEHDIIDEDIDDGGDIENIEDGGAGAETEAEAEAEADAGAELIANAKRRHGALGAVVAAGMFGLDQALGRKVKQEAPIVVSAPTEPVDIDTEGMAVTADDGTSFVAPALPRTQPKVATNRRPRR